MNPEKKNLLLTGRPRVGKSTLVQRVVGHLERSGYRNIGGFYTAELKAGSERVGFSITAMDGTTGRLAQVGLESPYRLGRYGIDMESFERVALRSLEAALERGGLVVIDEIGYMELMSRRFRDLALQALDSASPVLGTIMHSRYAFADLVTSRPDVEVIRVRVDNRDALVGEVLKKVTALLASGARARQG
jgi:nucleoside-triphosphatase